MHQDLEPPMQVGEVLTNKYRVERVLGAGGMGVVVAATHLQLDKLVALKFLRREALKNPKFVSRFEREARAAARLRSEHAARIIDVGRLETGLPYTVMEYLEGHDLAAILQQCGTIAVPDACDFIIQACDAIAEAHSLGIVHRDLKPGNLFLANTSHGKQVVKVLDFGISKSHMAADDPTMTSTQEVLGSPRYMSPEQMRSAKDVDGRTDIWSLGVILYELVTGQAPFHADTLTALCLKIAMEPLPALPVPPTALPPGFDAIIHRALEKDQVHRYQSANELAHALAPFASANYHDHTYRPVASTASMVPSSPPMAMVDPVTTLNTATGETRGQPVNQSWSRTFLLAGIGVGAVAAGIAVALMSGPGGEGGSTKGRIVNHAPDPVPEVQTPAKRPSETAVRANPEAVTEPKAIATPPEATVTSTAPKPVPLDSRTKQRAKPIKPIKPSNADKGARNERNHSNDKVSPPPTAIDPFSSPD